MCLVCVACTVAGMLVALLYRGDRPPAWVGCLSVGLMFGPWLCWFVKWMLLVPPSPRYRSWDRWRYGHNRETVAGVFDDFVGPLEDEDCW